MNTNSYQEKIARILRIEKQAVLDLEKELNRITGKSNFLYSMVEENERLIDDSLDNLGLGRNSMALDVYDALISKVESDDLRLFQMLGNPQLSEPKDCQRLVDLAKDICPKRKGFFLKKEIAEGFLKAEPPRKTLEALGYSSVEAMLAKENLLEVFSSLRFLEDSEWLNNRFFKQYQNLKAADFEEREIEVKVLGAKWKEAAEKFVRKKYHNISHLKELGVIFIIPITLKVSGEILRTLSLVAHYFNEVYFYSDLFKDFAENNPKEFSKNFISLLRGDVPDNLPKSSSADRCSFLVIQRYLAKDDENDHRLFLPHINPEALHWDKAEDNLAKIEGLDFWKNLDWIGDFFKIETGGEILVSFNLVDTVMSLVKEKEMVKYLYHHQEALWNKIFVSYFGQEKLEEMIKANLIKGWFEV
ncbi:MAG: hypothetical protein WC475_01930 [Candidatus Paceibacterota bacterium]